MSLGKELEAGVKETLVLQVEVGQGYPQTRPVEDSLSGIVLVVLVVIVLVLVVVVVVAVASQ